MDLSFSVLLAEARTTFTNPRAGVRRILSLGLPMGAIWLALAVVEILSTILSYISLSMLPAPEGDELMLAMIQSFTQSPLRTAVFQCLLIVGMAFLIFWFGRARGGRGSLADMLLALVWLQAMMLVLQVLQVVLQVALPPLAGVVNLLAFFLFPWLLTNFVAEVHGFRSLLLTFFGLLLGAVMAVLLLSTVVMALFGVPGAGV